MSSFFHGWRRKTGCIALVMATVFVLGWIRSYDYGDFLTCESNDRLRVIASVDGRLYYWSSDSKPGLWPLSGYATLPLVWLAPEMRDQMRGIAALHRGQEWSIAYWQPTVLLTPLSACLLIWPGKRPEQKPPPS